MDLRRGGRALADAVSSRRQSPRDFGEEGGRETRTSCATGVPARENPADPDGAAASPTKKPSASNKRDGRTERPARRGSEWRWAAPQLVDLEARSLRRSRPAFGIGTIIVAIEAATAAAGRV